MEWFLTTLFYEKYLGKEDIFPFNDKWDCLIKYGMITGKAEQYGKF